MKKAIYIALLTLCSALTISSCTEEEVKPQFELSGGGAGSTGGL